VVPDKIRIKHFGMKSYVKQCQTVKKPNPNQNKSPKPQILRYSASGWRYCLPSVKLPCDWEFYSLSPFISIVTSSFDSKFLHSGLLFLLCVPISKRAAVPTRNNVPDCTWLESDKWKILGLDKYSDRRNVPAAGRHV